MQKEYKRIIKKMHKNTLWLLFAILCIYLTLVFCKEQQEQPEQTDGNELEHITSDFRKSDSTDLQEEARTRRRHRHHLYHMWGWHALAIAYLVKIKIVVVAFFVGSAIYLGLRYFWPNKCNTEIILDHPPPSFSHHDHIPYSLGHSEHYADHPPFDSSSFSGSSSPGVSFDPYSSYSGPYAGADVASDTTSTETQTFRKKREVKQKGDEKTESVEEIEEEDDVDVNVNEAEQEGRQRPMATEEQIGNFMFSFLGLDSKSCRRRFICEMEFRSKTNPITSMAFRVIGRSFFGQYTNDRNEMGKAHSFDECAAVNSECVFIENDNNEEEANAEEALEEQETETETAADDLNIELPADQDNATENNNIERANYHNILAEKRNAYRRRVRGDRHLKQ